MSEVLQARGVTKRFGPVSVLDGVDFTVRAGEVHALIGENGAGKSTLIKILTGALTPDSGSVTLDDEPLPPDPRIVRRRGVSCVYQEFTLVPDLSVGDNVRLGRERGPFLRHQASDRAIETRLRDLGARCAPTSLVRSLSVADQQLVEIARALEDDARVLILDEPTAALSQHEVERLLQLIRDLRARQLGIVYVSHRFDEIFAIADRATVLRDGRAVSSVERMRFDRRELIRMMVGREVSEEFPPRTTVPGAPVLEVRHLTSPGRFTDVSFDVRAGEIVGIGGLVGAGRTSVGLALGGALPASGSVSLGGAPLARKSPADVVRQGLAYVTEDRKRLGILPDMSVSENLTVTYLRQLAKRGLIDRARERSAATTVAADVRIKGVSLDQPVRTLSGGTQQKTLLGRFLMNPVRVVVLDEPTRGVDVGARAEIYGLMNRLTEAGLAIVMISSDLPELLGMSDRVLVMKSGRFTGELLRADASPERVMALAAGA